MVRSDERYHYRYYKSGRWLWFGILGQGTREYRGGKFTFSERGMRLVLARAIKRHRLEDERRRTTIKRG